MLFLDNVAQAFFPPLLRATEVAARAIASTVGARDPRTQRHLQFLVFAFVACPLILLALAALVWGVIAFAHLIASLL